MHHARNPTPIVRPRIASDPRQLSSFCTSLSECSVICFFSCYTGDFAFATTQLCITCANFPSFIRRSFQRRLDEKCSTPTPDPISTFTLRFLIDKTVPEMFFEWHNFRWMTSVVRFRLKMNYQYRMCNVKKITLLRISLKR